MTDKPNPIKDLTNRLKDGIKKINEDAKTKAGVRDGDLNDQSNESETGPGIDNTQPNTGASPKHADRISAVDEDDIDDGFIIESEAENQPDKKKGLNTKQKLLFLAVLAAAGFLVLQKQSPAPDPQQIVAQNNVETAQTQPTSDVSAPPPAFDLESKPPVEAPIPVVSGKNDAALLGFGDTESKDAANEPIGTELLTADLNKHFESLSDETNEVLDPFTGKVSTAPVIPSLNSKQPTQANSPTTREPNPAAMTVASPAKTGETSPFTDPVSNSTELSGTASKNADSKDGVLSDPKLNSEVASLKKTLKEKDQRISVLEAENGLLKKNQAGPGKTSSAPKAQSGNSAVAKAIQTKAAKPSIPSTKGPAQSQRVASSPKAVPRPQMCVTAIAQAARNCTTCVPHAFITQKGLESQVGKGDFIDGLRVSIDGDRLDLQNAQGEVVHKFWSSPNGCAAG